MISQAKIYAVNSITRLNTILGIIAIAISFCFMSPATAITQEIELNSATGYRVETTFSYDENKTPAMIKEQGMGKTNAVDSMQVSFYNPAGELIATYDNIVDGVAQGNYFEFNFDPATQKLSGNIDLGGESAGEMYLKGEIEQGLSLIEVETTGEEKEIDRVAFDLSKKPEAFKEVKGNKQDIFDRKNFIDLLYNIFIFD